MKMLAIILTLMSFPVFSDIQDSKPFEGQYNLISSESFDKPCYDQIHVQVNNGGVFLGPENKN